jgi:signal transduction histidine kinase
MDKLLKKLSTISEIHKPGYFEEINIREICNSISLSFEETVKERGITFKSNIECDTNVLSIPKLVEVILFHLLENAFFFSWIDNEKKKDVKLDIHIHQEKLLITVADTGIGIEDEIQYKIFDMFYVGSEYSSGNGLGLYIVQKSVDLLNGKMKVSSDRNGSTKFIVQLPINGQGSNTLEFLDSLKA